MFSAGHIWLIAILFVVVLIIWGPGKLPDVGAGLGRAINEFRHASTATRDEFNKATRPDEAPATGTPAPAATVPPVTPAAPVAPVPAPLGAGTDAAPAATDPIAGEGDHQTPG